MLDVSPGMLRTWEREGLVAPDRTKGSHRIYRDTHIKRLRKIATLYFGERLNPAAIRRELGPVSAPSVQKNYVDANLGMKLRSLRQRKKLTLADLSAKSDLSQSFISALERGNTGVSVEALFRLAEALGTTLPTLKGKEGPVANRRFVPENKRQQFVTDDRSLIAEDLITKPAGMEATMAHIAPGADSDGVFSHKGQEFLYILAGQLSFWLEPDEFYNLKAGDALYLHSHLKHSWKNEGSTTTSVLWVNSALPRNTESLSEFNDTAQNPLSAAEG